MSVEFIFRIIGMIMLSIAGGYFGASISHYSPSWESVRIVWSSVLIGALAGLIVTPYVTTRPRGCCVLFLGEWRRKLFLRG